MAFKAKKPSLLILCSVGGMVYFNAVSSLNTHFIFQSYLILCPIATSILIHFAWIRQNSRSKDPQD